MIIITTIIKKIIFYEILSVIAFFISKALYKSPNEMFVLAGKCIEPLLNYYILFDIFRLLIKELQLSKEYMFYIRLLIGELLIMKLISKVLNISTMNTWLGAIGGVTFYFTFCMLLLKIVKSNCKENIALQSLLQSLIYIFMFFIVMLAIFGFTLAYLMGL